MNSPQLDLWPSWVARLPWEGRSPRSLGKVALDRGVIFKARAQKDARFLVDPCQLELFAGGRKGSHYVGAPTLLPLPRRER